MKTADIIEETFAALLLNKVRSGLTVLGIVIGIGSVIAMISIGQGAQMMIESNIQSLGSNLVMVMPGFQRGQGFQVSTGRGAAQTLTQADANAISQDIPEVQAVASELSSRNQVTARGTNTNTQVIGVTPNYAEIRNIAIAEGNFITDQNINSRSKVAVLGPTTRDDLFGENADALGQTIKIKNLEFKVVGITTTKGGTGFMSQDDRIFIPLSVAQQYLTGADYVSTISVQAQSQSIMTTMQESITSLLLDRHKITNPQMADFSILNQADIIATASSITGTFTIFLGAIAAISLLVGGIGIMNMMLTTVTERTREIGLRKAIGAKRQDVSVQFLTEAVMLTLFSGILGILVGWLISLGISKFGGITTQVSIKSILLAFSVSAAIGIIFGWWPAQKAAKLNPIDALRYE